MYFEFIPHVQGRLGLSHMHKRCVTHHHKWLYIGETWSSFDTHFVEAFSSFLDGAGAAFLILRLGFLWCNILAERSWWDVLGLCDTCGKLTLWSLCWLKHPADHRNATILYLCFGLSSIDLLVCSICILLSLSHRNLTIIASSIEHLQNLTRALKPSWNFRAWFAKNF